MWLASVEAKAPALEPPRFELRPGERYFRVDGRAAFVFGRNAVGAQPADYAESFRRASAAGERLVRIHFTHSPSGEQAGEVAAGMLAAWDAVLDAAEAHGLAVLPVLGVWADWNDGSRKERWSAWDANPFNAERGGPARHPRELFEDTPCRRLWLQRIESLVRRWAGRRAIVGWEIFSELDLVTGATPERAVEFVERAAAAIRAADPWRRPVTASQSGVGGWPQLLESPALDLVQVHPYAGGPFAGRLDELILSSVGERLAYGKPVLLGESGLDAAPPRGTLDTAPRAEIGVRHALWASIVSGAMNGRMLWWQDGYDRFEQADISGRYQDAAAPAVAFVRGVDFTGFAPLAAQLSPGLTGGVIGNGGTRLGWLRDARCAPPGWPMDPLPGQHVTLEVASPDWRIELFDPESGRLVGQRRAAARDGRLRLDLPEIRGSIAIRWRRVQP